MFTLKIKTDNAAFSEDPGYEIASILKKIAQKLERGETEGVAMDTNGNKVGRWELEESISAIERGSDMSKATEFVNELNTFQQGIVDLEREHGGDLLKNRGNSRDPDDHPKYLVAKKAPFNISKEELKVAKRMQAKGYVYAMKVKGDDRLVYFKKSTDAGPYLRSTGAKSVWNGTIKDLVGE